MRRYRRLLAVPAIAAVVLVTVASAASAHADLESAMPSPSTNLSVAPRAISLHFTEGVDVRNDAIRMFDASMNAVDVGDAHHPGGRSRVVVATVPKLDRGLYTVAWRAVSEDSHPIQGAFTFGVKTDASGAAASALTDRAAAGETSDRLVGVLFGVMRFGVFVGLALLLGIVAFVLFLWPAGRVSLRVRQVLGGALALTFVCTALGFLLQGPYSSGGGVGDMFSTDLISSVWDTRFGKVWVLRLVLLVVMGLLVRAIVRTGRGSLSRGLTVSATLVGVALAATPGLAGHASTGRWVVFALLMDVVHVLAMAIWIGGLVALGLARRDDVSYGTVATRFSGVALGAVVVLVLSGTFQSLRQLQPFSALWESTYGGLLIAKLAAFAVLIGIAAWSRRLVHGPGLGFRETPSTASDPVTVNVAPGSGVGTMMREEPVTLPEVHPGLSRSVRAELAFAAIVLAITSVLVNTSPPRASVTAGPVDAIIGKGATRFETFFGPAEAGRPNQVHITAVGRNGLPQRVVDMEASLSNPAKDVPPIEIPIEHAAKGHYVADDVRVPPGTWTLKITAYVTDVDVVTASTDVSVG